MPITWRPATSRDIEPSLSIRPKYLGGGLIGAGAAAQCWKQLACKPFFASAVLESQPAIRGHTQIGFGSSILVSDEFVDSEIAHPKPDINSRFFAALHSGRPVLSSRDEVARANTGSGVNVLILGGFWRDDILSPLERREVQGMLAQSFTEWHAGFRIRTILQETAEEPETEFMRHSPEYRPIVEFPEARRVVFMMSQESVQDIPASLGSFLFHFREPMLRLRETDQQLLSAALKGATDWELSLELGIAFSAVKARWRSTFARVAEVRPDLVVDDAWHEGRGSQKRHRVLAYLRNHPEELRPYHWKRKTERPGGLRPGHSLPSQPGDIANRKQP